MVYHKASHIGSHEVERKLRPQPRALSRWCLVPVQGEAFGPPVPISIPINTDKILARLRLPTSSSIVNWIFHASPVFYFSFPSTHRIEHGDWPGSAYRGV
ncbi:hypothetical protein PGT21_014713 [Puccinia graminis f. sp. tritici]|uniref:Uncharacterized protein n=1 Tax=Puccinia graminis f. sp. tritici TaxID=56615 RepID=A0A5B0P6W4_PUCGR|nr:hypothetical protein PGT21_014713 [Puccinia graminis f. sp. tritici]KAA1132052.1 hypothetical protein PGTUg99_036503 [Puccinia graminis f. sp. tritici]